MPVTKADLDRARALLTQPLWSGTVELVAEALAEQRESVWRPLREVIANAATEMKKADDEWDRLGSYADDSEWARAADTLARAVIAECASSGATAGTGTGEGGGG